MGCWALARQARVAQRAVLVVEEGAALAEQQEAQRAGVAQTVALAEHTAAGLVVLA